MQQSDNRSNDRLRRPVTQEGDPARSLTWRVRAPRLAGILSGILAVCWLPALVHAEAIAQANLRITMQFPPVVNNQFGYTSPKASLPDPITDEIPDGRVLMAKRSTVKAVNKNPLTVRATAGPMDLLTINDGEASALIEGDFFGRMANLTNAPLTVTFVFDVKWSAYTHIDMEGADFADESIFAIFQVGDWFDFSEEKSSGDGPPFSFGFEGGAIDVTLPPRAVVPYSVSWEMEGLVDSFCSDECGSTPEPGTFVLLGSGVLGLSGILRRRLMKRT